MLPLLFSLFAALAADPIAVDDARSTLSAIQAKVHEVHPAPFEVASEKEQARLLRKLQREVRAPIDHASLAALGGRLLAPLKDGHTSVGTSQDLRFVPARFLWDDEGLLMIGEEHQGRVARIAGRTPEELLEDLGEVIPADNVHWLRFVTTHALEGNVTWLALGHEGALDVTLADGSRMTLAFERERPVTRPAPAPAPDVWWTVVPEADLAWLRLSRCPAPDQTYFDDIADLFQELHARDLGTLVIDLRGNTGGSSLVLGPILNRLAVPDDLRTIRGIRRLSDDAVAQRGYVRSPSRMQPGTDLSLPGNGTGSVPRRFRRLTPYAGDVLVLTDGGTFSAATWVALTLSDNDMVELVGEPTGGAPTRYGDVLSFPDFDDVEGLSLGVSHTKWLRPDPSRDPADTLAPDHLVPTSAEDRLAGRDPVWAWILERQGVEDLPPPTPDPVLPSVVEVSPASGSVLPPGEHTLRVRFSEAMRPGTWSFVGQPGQVPEIVDGPRFVSPDTLEVRVKLEPGRAHMFGLNSGRFQGFAAADGTPATPFPWRIEVAGE